MAFRSLLLSKDAELVQTLARLLKDLDIAVEPCSEPFAAAKRLMDQHFDAILVDCDDEQGAGWVLQSARMATASKKSITIAIVSAQSASRGGPRAGENFTIQKPIVLKQVEATLRAARGLMGDSGSSPIVETPAVTSSAPAEKATPPAAVPKPHAMPSSQGRPPAELFDELTAAVDRLGPQAPTAKPAAVASSLSGSAAAAAPAREKPAAVVPPAIVPPVLTPPSVVPEPEPQPEPQLSARPESQFSSRPEFQAPPRPEAPIAPRPVQQNWPSLMAAPSAPPKPEVSPVLPLAASSADMKPVQEPAKASKAFDDARQRVSAAAPPAWRTDVEERHEPPVPRFSGFAMEDEEPRRSFPFKKIAIAMVLVSLGLFAYSWYRGRTSSTPAGPAQAPVAYPESQPAGQTPTSAAPAPAAVSPSNDRVDRSATEKVGSSEAEETEAPAAVTAKPVKAEARAHEADATAPDTTTAVRTSDFDLPPAPLVVEGGSRHSKPSSHNAEPVAPPSLDAVTTTAKSGLGTVVGAPVALPKLATAAPQRITVSQGVTQGLLVRQVKPQYPAMARETRVEGDVVLQALIGEDGTVRDLKAVSGPALLIQPALQAVRQWQYKPYLLNGQPVEVETQITVRFRL